MMLIREKKIWTPDNAHLLKYISECECGNIIIGQELWMQLELLKDDIENEVYIYDIDDALLRMDFMENCVRLTKSPYYNQPMKLMLWQKAFIEAVYSFKMPDTGHRRFKKVILLIARKNTKSETCSALGLSEFILGNPGSDIVASSNDDNQASIIYNTIDTMRVLTDPEQLDTKKNQSFILNKITNTKIFKLSDRTKNKEGRNIDMAFLDESHEMKNNIIAKSIEQSMSLKDEPLFINLTTEGFVVDGYLDQELARARKILRGEEDGPSAQRQLNWLYTQDSEQEVWQNRSSWVKSNPSLGIVKKWEYLDEQIDTAKQSKSDRIFVLCKDFNIKQNGVESWLNLSDYTYNAKFNLEDFRGCHCLGAVDLSETTDLTSAKIMMMKKDDNTKYILQHYWIPESKLENADDHESQAQYQQWAKDGTLTICNGSDIDLSLVADWFLNLYTNYGIRLWKCGYDQRFSRDWLNRMSEHGWMKTSDENTSDIIMINQNAQTLSNAIKLCESEFRHQLINYNEDSMDRWCFKNAGIQVDSYGKCLLIKNKASQRIDGAVSLVILYEMFRRYRTTFQQML